MDNSTIVFIFTLVVAFIVLRWLITPIPQSVPDEFNIPDPQRVQAQNNERPRSRAAREVTQSMIEVVQAIAPQLSPVQIRFSLERSGSVEATVEEYMTNGNLPFPPGYVAPAATEEEDANHNVAPKESLKNLLEKYGLDAEGMLKPEGVPEAKWGKDKAERTELLQQRREEMILKARRRMQKTLTNDVLGD